MATVGNIASMGYSSAASNSVKSKITAAQNELRDLAKNTSLSSEERAEKQKAIQEQISSYSSEMSDNENSMLAAMQTNTASLTSLGLGSSSSLFGNNTDINETGAAFFFGAKNTMSTLGMVNSARVGIENRARTLTSEIRMDKVRGRDTSGKEEALANLTSNLSIMDNNLGKNISKALDSDSDSTTRPDSSAKPIITQIKDALEVNQKVVEKKVAEKYGGEVKKEETETK